MRLVDEGLKEIFERNNINDFIQAFGYLVNTGCYLRVEVMSNCLNYFSIDDVNNYHLVVEEWTSGSHIDVTFYKKNYDESIEDYIKFCYDKSIDPMYNVDIHLDAYTEVCKITFKNPHDYEYVMQNYNGFRKKIEIFAYDVGGHYYGVDIAQQEVEGDVDATNEPDARPDLNLLAQMREMIR